MPTVTVPAPRRGSRWSLVALGALIPAGVAGAATTPFTFSTGDPDGLIATASRPPSTGKIETETADDFILTQQTRLNTASFTGLLTGGATAADVSRVTVDIYRVFPNESDTTRTITVPTRLNSPGDVELVGRDTASSDMTFTTTTVAGTFNAANSVVTGIHGSPNQTTGGEGAVSGTEVRFDVTFTKPLDLAADHYFFRPEVGVGTGEFLWLSAARPLTNGQAFTPDLQTWVRNETIGPDWVRVGADVVAGATPPAFNASFSIAGTTGSNNAIPLPAAVWPGAALLGALAARGRRKLLRTQ
jgi:hypothetical protein